MSWLNVILWSVGAALGLIGIAALLWSLFADRARGRRRCPRCWYDMAGVPGLTCPECGKAVRGEKKLSKTRRRWRWAGVALVVLVVGAGSALTPRVRAYGWWSLLPTRALMVMAPSKRHEIIGVAPNGTDLYHPATVELKRRVGAGQVTAAQWRFALVYGNVLEWRSTWPRGVNIRIGESYPYWVSGIGLQLQRFAYHAYLGHADREIHLVDASPPRISPRLGMPGEQDTCVELHVTLHEWEGDPMHQQVVRTDLGTVRLPLRFVEDIDQAIRPRSLPSEVVSSAFNVSAGLYPERTNGQLLLWVRVNQGVIPNSDQLGIGIRATLFDDVQPVCSADGYVAEQGIPFSGRTTNSVLLSFNSPELRETIQSPARLEGWWVLIEGDPDQALKEVKNTEYWSGSILYPLQDIVRSH